jgi:hypothetical protein
MKVKSFRYAGSWSENKAVKSFMPSKLQRLLALDLLSVCILRTTVSGVVRLSR